MTPVSMSPPIMMNRPGEEGEGGPLDLAEHFAGLRGGYGDEQAGAEEGDDAGLVVQYRVQDEAGDDQGEDDQALDEQPGVA